MSNQTTNPDNAIDITAYLEEKGNALHWDNPGVAEILSDLPGLYETDGQKGDLPAVKLFTPDAQATWILWESDDEVAFGLCDLGLGFPELGYVSVDELDNLRGRFGMPIEKDEAVATRFQGYDSIQLAIPEYLLEEESLTPVLEL